MRSLGLIVFLGLTATLNAQKINQHFSGALELGAGWGHAIDFTLDNNNLTLVYLVHRLFAIPWQGGIHTSRVLNHDSYLEFGMVYHRRSSDWVYQRSNNLSGSWTSTTHKVLALDCIDFSLKYYKFLDHWRNRELYAFAGMAPVWVLHSSGWDLNNNSLPHHHFRNWNLALAGGVALERGNVRWKLKMDLCIVPVANRNYSFEVPEEERAWGPYIFPIEALLCCAYLIH